MASALNVFLLFCEKNSSEDMLLFGGSISSIQSKYLEVDFGSVIFEGLINASGIFWATNHYLLLAMVAMATYFPMIWHVVN